MFFANKGVIIDFSLDKFFLKQIYFSQILFKYRHFEVVLLSMCHCKPLLNGKIYIYRITLTPCPKGDLKYENFKHSLWIDILSIQVNVTLKWGRSPWCVNIARGNDLVSSGNKPLTELVLTKIFNVIWCLSVTMGPLRGHHNGSNGVSNHQPHDCLLNHLFTHRSKTTSKLHVTGLCVGNSPGTSEFPTQMASNTENVYISWCHHAKVSLIPWWHIMLPP